MARYIDADKLISHLKDEIEGCKQPLGSRANGKGIAYGTELGLKSAISFAKTLSTEDVVPKSEVEQLKRNLEQCENGYSQELHLARCKLADAKSEVARVKQLLNEECDACIVRARKKVAREIFEEIEDVLNNIGYFDEIDFKALKKKYTKEE